MAWVLLIVALGLAVGLSIVTFGLNRFALAGLVALLVAVAMLIYYTQIQDTQKQALIEPGHVALNAFEMEQVYGGSYALRARVRNTDAEHTLTAFGLSVQALDCSGADRSECVVIGDRSQEIQIEVPPGQARDFYQQFQFRRMQPRGELRWSHAVEYTKAY